MRPIVWEITVRDMAGDRPLRWQESGGITDDDKEVLRYVLLRAIDKMLGRAPYGERP